ncbi:hypothetical protein SFRURICE_006377, partial [Spodoptera frugiperda]
MTRKRHSLVDIESSDDIFRDLVKKRGFVKAKFTLFVKYVQCLDESQIKEAQKVELQERLQRSQLLFDKFSEIQDELDIIVSGSQVDKELEERELFENQYYAIVAKADFLETVNKPSHSKQAGDTHHTHFKKPLSIKSHSHVTTHKHNNKSLNSQRYKCSMCSSNHPLYSCESFLSLTLKDKLKLVQDKNLCRNCLRVGHAIAECWYGPCKLCNKEHNTLIHSEFVDDSASTQSAVAYSSQTSVHSKPSTSTHTNTSQSASHTFHTLYKDNNHDINAHYLHNQVLLSTALVDIADKNNKYHTIRALLDNGSQHCFISETLCKSLDLPLLQSTVQVIGVGNSITQSTQSCQIRLRSKTSLYNTQFNCLVLPCITSQLPSLGVNHNIQIPEHVQLADSEFYLSKDIQLLIGADKYWELLNEGLIRLPKGPYLQNTQLGWIISGSVHKQATRINRTQCNHTQTLDAELKRFWELEEIISIQNKLTKEESACETLFTQTTLRGDKGHSTIVLGWLKTSPNMLKTFVQNRVVEVNELTGDRQWLHVAGKQNPADLLSRGVHLDVLIYICLLVYLPPNYTDEQYLNVLTCIENVICTYSDLNVLILGDFNLNSCSTNIKTTFDYFCEFCSLKQYNTVLNNRGGMLDLVLGNFEPNQIAVSHSEDPLVNIDQYHPMLDIIITYPGFKVSSRISSPQQVTPRSDTSTDWKWRKADFQGLYNALAEVD